MADSIDRVFVHALNTVKKIPPRTARPPTAERLKLYGLYKQSMEGDVEGVMDRPLGNTTDVYAECEKWDAWFAQRGLSRTEAKRRYISTLIETMHRHASQTSEARELVAELEFVWDQIKANVSSSSSGSARGGRGGREGGEGEGGGSALSSPVRPVVVPPSLASPQQQQQQVQVQRQHLQSQRGYGSIGGRLAQPSYEDMVAIANASAGRRGDVRDSSSRLRVLSPVSQPDEMYQRRGSGMRMRSDGEGDRGSQEEEDDDEEEEDEDEDEEFEEAPDTLYDDDDDNDQHISDEEERYHHQEEEADSNDRQSSSPSSLQQQQHSKKKPSPSSSSPPRGRKPAPQNKNKTTDPRRWRRRVEQALTNMTAEVAAVREQMETRAIHHRRRSSAWAWLKWLAWVTLRQVIWDLAILGMLLIWMRIKGDRRVEEKLKAGWSEVKRRLPGRVRSLRRFGLPLLP